MVVRLPGLQGVAHDKGSMLICWPWHMPMLHPVSDEHVPESPGGKPGWAAQGCQDLSLEVWAEGARGQGEARLVEEEGLGATAGQEWPAVGGEGLAQLVEVGGDDEPDLGLLAWPIPVGVEGWAVVWVMDGGGGACIEGRLVAHSPPHTHTLTLTHLCRFLW